MTLTNTKLTKSLFFAGLLMLASLTLTTLFNTGSAHAVSITVATGDDEVFANSNCSLSEAITNINNGNTTSYPECTSTNLDPFGTDDTITIPAGTITLTADLPQSTKSIAIQGAGMGQTTIDQSNGQYGTVGLIGNSDLTLKVKDIKITAFKDYGIVSNGVNVNLDGVDIDANNAVGGAGVLLMNEASDVVEFTVNNVHIHNFINLGCNGICRGLTIAGGDLAGTGVINANISNVTVDTMTSDTPINAIVISQGADNSLRAHTINANIDNTTISNITSTVNAASLAAAAFNESANGVINLKVRNTTIVNLEGSTGPYGASSGYIAATAAIGQGVTATINVESTNVLVANNLLDGTPQSCAFGDYTSQYNGSGNGSVNSTSHGGNLSDDNTCKDYFTKSTDKNNLTNLSSTLGPLSNNGGYVPTIPLLQGSQAIDSGVTVSGLTTDARLATRPQGSTFDSGAYESPFTKESEESLAGTGERVGVYALFAYLITILGATIFLKNRFMLQ